MYMSKQIYVKNIHRQNVILNIKGRFIPILRIYYFIIYYLYFIFYILYFFIRKRERSSFVIAQIDFPKNVTWTLFITYSQDGQWHVDAFFLSVNQVSFMAHSVFHVFTQLRVEPLLPEKSFLLCRIKWCNCQKQSSWQKQEFFFLFLQTKLSIITVCWASGMTKCSFFFCMWFKNSFG